MHGTVETRSRVTVTRSGETNVIVDQEFGSNRDSVRILSLNTFSTEPERLRRDTATDALASVLPFCETDFDTDIEYARLKERELVSKLKTPAQLENDSTNWWYMFKRGKLSLRDPYIHWPRGTNWLINVIRSVDHVFNAQDTTYITGTGYRFKAYLTTENWFDSYAMRLGKGLPMTLRSDLTSTLGLYVNAVGISLGYSVDMTHTFAGRKQVCKKWELGADTELFTINFHRYSNNYGSFVRSFGNVNYGHPIHMEMAGMRMKNIGADLYFYINNKRYSRAAAYSFSKIQKKSAGSIIVGLQYTNLDLNIDLSTLPSALKPMLPDIPQTYRFHYSDYAFIVGYGYNFALGKNFLLNLTGTPSIGWNTCYPDSSEGSGNLVSLNVKGSFSLVWNSGRFFAGIKGRADGHWYRSFKYSVFDSLLTFTGQFGVRF